MSTNVSSATKFFPEAQNGFTTTLASTIASGATTVPLNSVAGYTNGATAVFVVDPTSATAKQTFTGVIDTSGVQVTNVVWTAGTNQTHLGGVTVVDYATATHVSLIAKGLLVAHNSDGTHKSGATYLLPTIASFANANHDHSNSAGGGQISNTGISGVSTLKLANPYKFAAYRNAAFSIPGSSAFTKVTFDTKEFDTGTNFDIVTNVGRFTAPVAGFYRFTAAVGILTSGAFVYGVNLYKNGVIFKTLGQVKTGSANTSLGGTALVQASLNDYFEIYVFSADTGANNANVAQAGCWFAGELVSAT